MPGGNRRGSHCVLLVLCLVLILLLGFLDPASAASSIALGSKLLPTDSQGWVSSPNQSFRLSFYRSSENTDRFSVGVLYNSGGVNGTVAWTAGGNIQVGTAGSLELSSDGVLILRNDSVTTVWNSSTGNLGVAVASMGDDGNFVLLNRSGSTVWQSFDSPTDTLVMNQLLQQGSSLTAGDYTANLQASGNLSLIYDQNGGYTYWSSDTEVDNSSVYASFNEENATFSIYNAGGEALRSWYSKDYTSTASPPPVRRVTLDTDGNLRIYTTSSAGNWMVGWEALQDYCQIYGYCGPNGLCSYNESGRICTCASQAGYALIDKRNPRNGCVAVAGIIGQNCSSQSASVMLEFNHTMLFVAGTTNRNFRYGDLDCSQNCLLNTECIAATALSDGSGTCQMILSNTSFSGNQELSISTNSYFKFCGSDVPPPGLISSEPPPSQANKGKTAVTVPVVVSVLATLALLAIGQVGVWWLCCRKNPRWGGYSAHYALMEYASGAPVQFTYRELRKATGSFKEKLGEGGFGAVYKGELPTISGQGTVSDVAVKRLEGLAEQGEKQFRMEVAVIGSTHHMNLVRLCGFCAEGRHRLLVYEYMSNGSLDNYLFEGEEETALTGGSGVERVGEGGGAVSRRRDMDWETRYNVLLGTARGITYLHQECRDCIIHSDIKPENILLDSSFTAKVSDFGLARLTRPAGPNHHVTTLVRGTRGYLAPEWRSNLPITVKADVFSFGLVVLETLSGRRSFDSAVGLDTSSAGGRQVSFPEWAYRQFFVHKQVEGVMDERIKGKTDMEQFERGMKVAFWCVQVQPSMRPSLSKVIQMLDGTMQDIQTPPMPKSFGDQMANVCEEDSNYGLRVFEQESFTPPSSTTLNKHSSYMANTSSQISSLHPPDYNFSESLHKHQDHPAFLSNVHFSI